MRKQVAGTAGGEILEAAAGCEFDSTDAADEAAED